MKNSKAGFKDVVFDDRALNEEGTYKSRRIFFAFAEVFFSLVITALAVIGFFFPAAFIFAILFLVVLFAVVSEDLKIKNSRLIITENSILVKNRLGRVTEHSLDYKTLSLKLKASAKRGGGIIYKFYNNHGELLIKYEDMLNFAAPYGYEKTKWESAVQSLGMKITDENEIFKNS